MAKDVTNIPRETTMVRIANALESMANYVTLDGTADGYRDQMRAWFNFKGAADATPEELTELCNEWYAMTRPTWRGGTQFYQPDISSVSYGTATGDNDGMVCEPSTDTVAGQDDYAGNPLFACTDVNWELDENGDYLITEIDGITDGFRRKDPSKYVGVMQMTPWIYELEDDTTYEIGISGTQNCNYDVFPAEEAVRTDGTVSQFVLHGKYVAQITDEGAMTCCSGVKPTGFQSHNSGHTASALNGANYSGMSCCDVSWMQLMMAVMFKSITMDTYMKGCCNYSIQSPAQVSETGVKRVLVEAGTDIEVGINVMIGTYQGSVNRGESSMYDISGVSGYIVTAVESTTVDGTTYDAVYVDADDYFDTTANGEATTGTTYISTYNWPTGTTDAVLGNHGSIISNTDNRHPAKLQGIEYMCGQYEILNDTIVCGYTNNDGVMVSEPYVVRDRSKQSTAPTDDYEPSGLTVVQQGTSDTNYTFIKRLRHARGLGVTFGVETGGSSSTYTRDCLFPGQQVTSNRAYYCFGYINTNSTAGGLSLEDCGNGLSSLHWGRCHRLSPNGTRGEWSA